MLARHQCGGLARHQCGGTEAKKMLLRAKGQYIFYNRPGERL